MNKGNECVFNFSSTIFINLSALKSLIIDNRQKSLKFTPVKAVQKNPRVFT